MAEDIDTVSFASSFNTVRILLNIYACKRSRRLGQL